jgi:hypothetical protein
MFDNLALALAPNAETAAATVLFTDCASRAIPPGAHSDLPERYLAT